METAGLLHRRSRVHSSLPCATISIAQKSTHLAPVCEYRLPKVTTGGPGGDGARPGLQYRRAKTAAADSGLHAARRGSGASEKGHVRRSALSLSASDARLRAGAGPAPEESHQAAQDTPIAHRTLEERLSNPDRLSLDRRGLTVCPRLEGEENLRLLNLQHNAITQVRNLAVLRKLIFLDLYDNRIERMSGLSCLRSLRVLMLGKNHISSIDGLEALDKLDVLDLHGNEIDEITNLSHLTELRVLNLAGNRLRAVRGLLGMRSLTELNLRRNRIALVEEVDQLPLLERIFLSHNDIHCWAQIEAVARSESVSELTLDGNPLSREKQYRLAAIHCICQVRSLDMKRITDEERRLALAWSRREEEKKKEMSRMATIKDNEKNASFLEKRRQALSHAKQQWELSHMSLWNRTGRVMRIPDLYEMHSLGRPLLDTGDEATSALPSQEPKIEVSIIQPPDTKAIAVSPQTSWSRNQARSTVESVLADFNHASNSQLRSQDMTAFHTTDSGFESSVRTNRSSEIEFDEVDGAPPAEAVEEVEDPTTRLRPVHVAEVVDSDLILYGPGAFAALEGSYVKEIANSISTIVFKYMHFEDVIRNLPRLRAKYPSVTALNFSSTGISTLAQLGRLAQIRRLDSVTIDPEGNPVTALRFWRPYLFMRLAHANLRRINGIEATDEEWDLGRALFRQLAETREWRRAAGAPPGSAESVGPRSEQQQMATAVALEAVDRCLRADLSRSELGREWGRVWRTLVARAAEVVVRGIGGPPEGDG